MKKHTTILLVFCLNAVFTYGYIYYVVGTFDVHELLSSVQAGDEINFLYDIIQYSFISGNVSLEEILYHAFQGGAMVHAVVLGYLYESNMLYSAVIVNSILVAWIHWVFHGKNKHILFAYVLLSPFYIYYSIGWTKEIVLTLALSFFFRSTVVDYKKNIFISLIISLLSRPMFSLLIMVAFLTKNVSTKRHTFFILALLAFSPFWLRLLPDSFISAAQEIYYQQGQGVSAYTDYLKNNVPILSIFGYLATVCKLYFEPLAALIVVNGIRIYSLIEFYLLIVVLIFVIRSRFNLFKNRMIFVLFLLINILICSLPFSHFRYMLPMLVSLTIHAISVAPSRIELKRIPQDA